MMTNDARQKKFLINSCGRAGSMYTYTLLNRIGIPTIHERNETFPIPHDFGIKHIAETPEVVQCYQGFVGWKWSITIPKDSFFYDRILHQVRHPLKNIKSATTHSDSVFSQIENKLGSWTIPEKTQEDPIKVKLNRAANYWLRMNSHLEELSEFRYKIEDIKYDNPIYHKFCELLNIPMGPRKIIDYIDRDVNTRAKAIKKRGLDDWTWEDMKETIDPDLYEAIRNKAKFYGYEN